MLLPYQSLNSSGKGKLRLLLKCRKILDVWNVLPFTYSGKSQQFLVKSPVDLRVIRWKLILTVSFTFLSFLQSAYIGEVLTTAKLLQCCFYVLYSSCGCYTINDQLNNCQDIVSLLNGMLVFERGQHKGGNLKVPSTNLRKRLCIPLIKILTFAGTFIPLIGQVSFFRKPCIPIQPGFFLINRCNNATVMSPYLPPSSPLVSHSLPLPSLLVMAILGLITCSCRLFMLNSFIAQLCIGVIIQPYCLHSYILILAQKTLGPFQACNVLFRQIQLLIKTYNHIYRRSTVCVLFFTVAEGTLSTYAFISLSKHLSTERRVIFGYTAIVFFSCVTIIYGTLAAIHEEALQFLQVFKTEHRAEMRRRFNRKLVRSYAPVKIALGDSNFVDISTPPICQNLIIEQTVNLALLD